MGIETQPGEVYRVIVALDGHVLVAAGCRFRRFERAQARVAETVCRYARSGRVRAVAVQRGRPNAAPTSASGGSPAQPPLEDTNYNWTIEKHWGAEVIRRILLQRGIEPAPTTTKPQLTRNAPQRPDAERAAISHADTPRPFGQHKNTRWHAAATLAVIIVALVALIFFQTGGHPSRLLSAITGVKPTVMDELPFDARTSFAPEPQPDASEPGGVTEDEEPNPTEGP